MRRAAGFSQGALSDALPPGPDEHMHGCHLYFPSGNVANAPMVLDAVERCQPGQVSVTVSFLSVMC